MLAHCNIMNVDRKRQAKPNLKKLPRGSLKIGSEPSFFRYMTTLSAWKMALKIPSFDPKFLSCPLFIKGCPEY